jgi:4-hydroxy-tetrahydrodipicolinate synthase
MKKFIGTGVAVVTPFKKDFSVDFSSMGKILNHLIEGGADYIVILGTTGEATTISKEEKKAIISYSAEIIAGKVPLVIGIGGNNTTDIVDSILSTDMSGVDAILSVSPYYNKPDQRGLYQHYKTIASSSPIPLILYNVPSRTACNIAAETTLRLAKEHSNIIGIKEASGDMNQVMKIIRDKPDNFLVISGDDMSALQIVAAGGSGVISVLANAFPSEWSSMIRLSLNSNLGQARDIHYKYLEIIELLFEDGNPAGIKFILNNMGLCQNVLRLPLLPVTPSLQSKMTNTIKSLN